MKKLLYKTIAKTSNQNTEKSPGIEFKLFNCMGEMGMDNFAYLNNSLSLFYFYFVTNLRKKIMVDVHLQLNLPPHPIRASALLAGPSLPPPSVRTLWITPFMGKLYLTDSLFLHYYFLDFFSRLPVY